MSMAKNTGPAQPNQVERPEADGKAKQPKGSQQDRKGKSDDMPGADGERSAGANEDTYD